MNLLRALGYELIYKSEKDLRYLNEFEDVEVAVCYNPFDTLDITRMDKLKWIQLTSVGVDQIPKEYVCNKKIIVTNNKGGYSIPIGEWIVLKILELLKNSRSFYENQQEKRWKIDTSLLELYGKTVGFIGTGSIAKEAAKRLEAFGVNIFGVNSDGRDIKYFHQCFKIDHINNMLSQCDIVVVSIPYTEKTHHIIDEKVLESMKEVSYLINIARGSIINEIDLIKYLTIGKIAGAALDVFENEPLDKSSPLWEMDNVIITPHNSWISEMRHERRFDIIYENMKRYINGQSLQNIVDLSKGY